TRLQGDWSSDVCSSDLRKQTDEVYVVAASSVHLVRFLPDSESFVSVNHDGSVSLWDARELTEIERISKLGSDNGSCVISPDGRRSEERRVGKECRAGGV